MSPKAIYMESSRPARATSEALSSKTKPKAHSGIPFGGKVKDLPSPWSSQSYTGKWSSRLSPPQTMTSSVQGETGASGFS